VYAKIFESMYDGSLATVGPWEALVTFQQMLVLADRYGVVDMTPEAISRRTTIPLEIIRKGIAALEQPDSLSRDPNLEGRRITRLAEHRDWGWEIVNHSKYRQIRSAEERRDYQRKWQAKRRLEEKKTSAPVNPDSPKEKSTKRPKANGKHPIGEWTPSPDFLKALAEHYHATQADLQRTWENLKDYCASSGKQYADYNAAFRSFLRRDMERSKAQ